MHNFPHLENIINNIERRIDPINYYVNIPTYAWRIWYANATISQIFLSMCLRPWRVQANGIAHVSPRSHRPSAASAQYTLTPHKKAYNTPPNHTKFYLTSTSQRSFSFKPVLLNKTSILFKIQVASIDRSNINPYITDYKAYLPTKTV